MTDTKGLVDLHCHLDLYPDLAAAVRECEEAEIFTLTVTTTPRAWPRNLELTKGTRHVRAALGLHPQLVADRAAELSIWESYLPETRYVGEVGLDAGPRFYRSFETQKQVFERVLKCCAASGDKIITVHSVRSAKTVLDHVESFLPRGRGKVVLHWFTGTKTDALRAVDMGCYFSINAAMLATDRHASLVAAIPMERLLTETDGPFTKTDERPSKPADVGVVVEGLGRLHKLASATIAGKIRDNLRSLLE
jgi:TatD DNase family protein